MVLEVIERKRNNNMDSHLVAVRKAVLCIFFLNGFVLSSWIPYIPVIKHHFDLGEALLGMTLLSMALGAVIAMPLSGFLCSRFGSRFVTILSGVLFCCLLPIPILASDFNILLLGLFLFGACNGAMDVAMNDQAAAIEKRWSKPIMSRFHGFFSLGTLMGASLGALLLSTDLSKVLHVVSVAGLTGFIMILMWRYCLKINKNSEPSARQGFKMPSKYAMILGFLALFALMAEGAIVDWSSVYFTDNLGVDAGLASSGFIAFAVTMTLGRIWGDKLRESFGTGQIVFGASILAAFGLSFVLLLPFPLTGIIGFACVGLGISNLNPVLLSISSTLAQDSPETAITTVTLMGYLGFIVGPAFIGVIAEITSLPIALGIIVLSIIYIGFSSRKLKSMIPISFQ